MKHVFILIVSVSLFGAVSAGRAATLLKDSTVGFSYETGLPLTATRHILPGKIFGWHWDGCSDNLLLELRDPNKRGASFKNEGVLNMLDLKTNCVKWSRKVNYNSSKVKLSGNCYFLTDRKKNLRLDPETGNTLWESKCEFYFIDPFLNIGVGYPVQSLSDRLSAVDLSSGRVLWNRKIDRTFGWNDAYMLSDSMLLISVNGLHGVDLTNGRGWSYRAKTRANAS
jgi:outer membrane protein assembly factor BamB